MKIIVIGAGMAGLLAARMLGQRGHKVQVLEAQSQLPNNHNAVLRFRSNVVSDITGIPFTKVQMIKCTVPYLNPVAEALAYSYKATGTYATDRSIVQGLQVSERWIAPPNFIEQLAQNSDIEFNSYQMQAFDMYKNKDNKIDAIISTIPMPKLIELLTWSGGNLYHVFKSKPGVFVKTNIKDCYAFATLYFPDLGFPVYRASITGDELILEMAGKEIDDKKTLEILAEHVAHCFGIEPHGSGMFFEAEIQTGKISVHPQPYAKIEPVDAKLRKQFMAWATDKHNVYSLGRYATWRPGLLLDDLVQDVKLIEHWITEGNYEARKQR